MHPCLEGSLLKAFLEHFFDYNLYAIPQNYPYYYEPNREHSPKTRIPFCERSGEQPPADNVGHPGDVYLVLPLGEPFQLYGYGANGWQKWSIESDVRHPHISDRYLWCNERAATWLSRTMVDKHLKTLLDQGIVKKREDRQIEAVDSDVESLILHRLLDEAPLGPSNPLQGTKRPFVTDTSPQKKPKLSSMASPSPSVAPTPVVSPGGTPRLMADTKAPPRPSHNLQSVRIPSRASLGNSSIVPLPVSAGSTSNRAFQPTLPPNVPQSPAANGNVHRSHMASQLSTDSKTTRDQAHTSSVLQDTKDQTSSQMQVDDTVTSEQPQCLSPHVKSFAADSKMDTSFSEADSGIHGAKTKYYSMSHCLYI